MLLHAPLAGRSRPYPHSQPSIALRCRYWASTLSTFPRVRCCITSTNIPLPSFSLSVPVRAFCSRVYIPFFATFDAASVSSSAAPPRVYPFGLDHLPELECPTFSIHSAPVPDSTVLRFPSCSTGSVSATVGGFSSVSRSYDCQRPRRAHLPPVSLGTRASSGARISVVRFAWIRNPSHWCRSFHGPRWFRRSSDSRSSYVYLFRTSGCFLTLYRSHLGFCVPAHPFRPNFRGFRVHFL